MDWPAEPDDEAENGRSGNVGLPEVDRPLKGPGVYSRRAPPAPPPAPAPPAAPPRGTYSRRSTLPPLADCGRVLVDPDNGLPDSGRPEDGRRSVEDADNGRDSEFTSRRSEEDFAVDCHCDQDGTVLRADEGNALAGRESMPEENPPEPGLSDDCPPQAVVAREGGLVDSCACEKAESVRCFAAKLPPEGAALADCGRFCQFCSRVGRWVGTFAD